MSWRAGLSRYMRELRFFACPDSPASKGVMKFYVGNYDYITILNPNFPYLLRTCENAMPAVRADIEWTKTHLAQYMIQVGRFRNPNGTIAEDRVEAAKAYIAFDWERLGVLRWSSKNFDPERPYLDEERPGWRDEPKVKSDLQEYFATKNVYLEAESIMQSGPQDEWTRAENSLLMAQRIDLWCAGPAEVERAVVHLYKISRALNEREVDMPSCIVDFFHCADDVEDH